MQPNIIKAGLCSTVSAAVVVSLSGLVPVTAHATPEPATGDKLAGRTVFLDPGHQGSAHSENLARQVDNGRGGTKDCQTTGTTSLNGVPEHTINWEVAQLVKASLQALGAQVVLSRADDAGWGGCVDDRARAANESGAAVAVSIHADSAPADQRGFHLIVPQLPIPDAAADRAQSGPGRTVSTAVRDAYLAAGFPAATYAGVSDGLQTRADVAGPALTQVPLVFVEMGNAANPEDAAVLESREGQLEHAIAIVTGVAGYLLNTPVSAVASDPSADEPPPPNDTYAEPEAAPGEEAPGGSVPADPAEEAPAPTDQAPADPALTDQAPAESAPVDEAPADAAPAEQAPAEGTPTDPAPAEGNSTQPDEPPAEAPAPADPNNPPAEPEPEISTAPASLALGRVATAVPTGSSDDSPHVEGAEQSTGSSDPSTPESDAAPSAPAPTDSAPEAASAAGPFVPAAAPSTGSSVQVPPGDERSPSTGSSIESEPATGKSGSEVEIPLATTAFGPLGLPETGSSDQTDPADETTPPSGSSDGLSPTDEPTQSKPAPGQPAEDPQDSDAANGTSADEPQQSDAPNGQIAEGFQQPDAPNGQPAAALAFAPRVLPVRAPAPAPAPVPVAPARTAAPDAPSAPSNSTPRKRSTPPKTDPAPEESAPDLSSLGGPITTVLDLLMPLARALGMDNTAITSQLINLAYTLVGLVFGPTK